MAGDLGAEGHAKECHRQTHQRLSDLAQEIPPPEQQTPEALGKLQKAEIEKWWSIIKAAGIKAE